MVHLAGSCIINVSDIYYLIYSIYTSSLNYLVSHVEFALKAYEICGYTRGRRYDKLGIQIAEFNYYLHNLIDLSTKEQFLDVDNYYKLLSERNRITDIYLRFVLTFHKA